MDPIELTPNQIAAIYNAGRARGLDEANVDEGSALSGDRYNKLRDLFLFDRENGLVAELHRKEKDEWWIWFKATLPPES